MYTTIQKFRVSSVFFKEINTFIQKRCIELVKGDSNEIYNVINILKSDVLLNFLSIKES